MGGRDRTSDRRLLVLVVDTLAGKVGGAALRDLEDDGRLGVARGLEDGVDLREMRKLGVRDRFQAGFLLKEQGVRDARPRTR